MGRHARKAKQGQRHELLELIELDPIACESYQTKEVLKILLHSIIFQRALNEHRLCDCESDLLDLSYVRCDSHGVSQRVEEYAEGLSSALERTHFTSKVGKSAGPAPAPVAVAPMKICLAFVEPKEWTPWSIWPFSWRREGHLGALAHPACCHGAW